jgi:ribonucleoside-diphosphate reductase alpha chain
MQNNSFPQPICDQIWNAKYRLITPNLDIRNDNSVQDTWDRIARACAEDDQELYNFLYSALEDFKFLPAGRITAGAGSGRNVTLFNCYVMGTIPDSISGIFDMLKEAALTMQQGGGIGYDFTTLRPKDSPVKGVDADASGPLTFMDVWDAMCRTVMSAGSRRGAMMATMRCDHPDIEDFITAKSDTNRLRMFNVSVLATDEFMSCVKNDADWPLMHEVPPAEPVTWNNVTQINGKHIYKVIRAKDLWETMMKSTYAYAEPGVLFIDRINNMNNLHYCEYISATNPCGMH